VLGPGKQERAGHHATSARAAWTWSTDAAFVFARVAAISV
jgi:hypothetical protein